MKRISLLLLFLIGASVLSQDIYNFEGVKYGKIAGVTNPAVIVIDTVRLDTGYYKIDLNQNIFHDKRDVSPSSIGKIYVTVTQMLDSTTQTIHYYGASPVDDGKAVVIKSHSNTDSSKVTVMIVVN